jgi:hypothetical protein
LRLRGPIIDVSIRDIKAREGCVVIHHISIPAREPARVARVLAAFWRSEVLPFPMYEDSHIVFSDEGGATAIEVYPAGRVLEPSTPDLPALVAGEGSPRSAFHAAISVPVDERTIHRLCAEQGWHCQTGSRGSFFQVVEVWVENHTLLELLTPEMASDYAAFANPANWKAVFGVTSEVRP